MRTHRVFHCRPAAAPISTSAIEHLTSLIPPGAQIGLNANVGRGSTSGVLYLAAERGTNLPSDLNGSLSAIRAMSGSRPTGVSACRNRRRRQLWVADSTRRRNTLDAIAAEGVLQMKRRPRIFYSASQRALIWERWRKGETLHQIARLFDRYHSSIQRIVAESGGIRPTQRRRSRSALTLIEREEISRGVVAGKSMRAIAARLGRAPSTISREIRRNDGPQGYRASQAEGAAWDRGCRPQVCKLVQNRSLAHLVAHKLRIEWSPEQIAGWLKRTYPDDEAFRCPTRRSIAAYSSRHAAL